MGMQAAVFVEEGGSEDSPDVLWTQIIHHAIRNGGSKNVSITAVQIFAVTIVVVVLHIVAAKFRVGCQCLLYNLLKIENIDNGFRNDTLNLPVSQASAHRQTVSCLPVFIDVVGSRNVTVIGWKMNVSPRCLDPGPLFRQIRFVLPRSIHYLNFFPEIDTNETHTVSSICNKQLLSQPQHYGRRASRISIGGVFLVDFVKRLFQRLHDL
mmetsp:Transcript_22409/g.47335  ORF Transcript_22409/g.47335 Transcript_22409/m.47335 type:complete len:209 (-) Transcript_22409:737-1363(-)